MDYLGRNTVEVYINEQAKQTENFMLGVIQEYFTEQGYHEKLEINGANLKIMVGKQIAKKPLKESQCPANAFNGWYLWRCPSCYHQLGVVNRPNMTAYCSDCGQKLNWGE